MGGNHFPLLGGCLSLGSEVRTSECTHIHTFSSVVCDGDDHSYVLLCLSTLLYHHGDQLLPLKTRVGATGETDQRP